MRSPYCLCVCMYSPPIVARQWLGKQVPMATKKKTKNRTIVGRVFLYAFRVALRESRRLLLPRTTCYIIDRQGVHPEGGIRNNRKEISRQTEIRLSENKIVL
jgi:hypothetical protein